MQMASVGGATCVTLLLRHGKHWLTTPMLFDYLEPDARSAMGRQGVGEMAKEFPYKVRWIVAPLDPSRAGLYGTTTHPSRSPAGAALASAESVMRALCDEERNAQIHILSVFADGTDRNLLSGDDLQRALRRHDKVLPLEVVHRPLC